MEITQKKDGWGNHLITARIPHVVWQPHSEEVVVICAIHQICPVPHPEQTVGLHVLALRPGGRMAQQYHFAHPDGQNSSVGSRSQNYKPAQEQGRFMPCDCKCQRALWQLLVILSLLDPNPEAGREF